MNVFGAAERLQESKIAQSCPMVYVDDHPKEFPVMSSYTMPIEVLRSASRPAASMTVRADGDWTVEELLSKAGLDKAEETVIATRSVWEYYRELEARSAADRSSLRLTEENRRLSEEVVRLESLLQRKAGETSAEQDGSVTAPNSARSHLSRRNSVTSMVSYQSEAYMEHQESEILRLDQEVKSLKDTNRNLHDELSRVRTDLDKANSDNVQLKQQAADLLADRESLLRRLSTESAGGLLGGGSPDSAAGAVMKSPEGSSAEGSLRVTLSPTPSPPPPPPASPGGFTEASSPTWCSSATPAIVLDGLLPYSPDTAAGGLDRTRTDDVVHTLTIRVAELERDKEQLVERLSKVLGGEPSTSRPSCSPSSAGRSFGASLCDELTAFHNAEKVEELEAESDMLRDTVARYRSLVQRKDEYLARIVVVLREDAGQKQRRPVGEATGRLKDQLANARFASYKQRLNRDRMTAVAGWLKAMASRDRPSSNHRWRAIFSWESPRTCDICGKSIYVAGETWRRKALAAVLVPSRAEHQQQGCECIICGQVAHFYCAHRHAHRVPCRWDFTEYPPKHRWLRGNLPAEAMNCQVCYKPCSSEQDYRCVLCRRYVHGGKCREKIGAKCDLGPLGFACLKPACFVDIATSTPKARTQSDVDGVLSPRASTQCSTPLLADTAEPTRSRWSIAKLSLGLYKLVQAVRGRRKPSSPKAALPKVEDHPPVVTPSFVVSREGCQACGTTSPVLCFINPKSGGLQGRQVRDLLYGTLHPRQVVDVTKPGQPRSALLAFSPIADSLRVLVCGGDGTVGWILGETEAAYGPKQFSKVPVSIMPMGTGNDLSAILGCGREIDLSEVSMRTAMAAHPEGHLQRLDRWNVKFDYYRPHNRIRRSLSAPRLYGEFIEDEDYTAGLDTALQVLSPETERKVIINYLDIGAAARIAGQFHHHRETFPELFTTRFENKVRYGELGFADFLGEEPVSLKDVSLMCDGVPVELPCNGDLADIIIVNIPSFAGAVDLWGTTSPRSHGYQRQRVDDGVIEVVAVSSLFHLGKVQVGLSSPYAVCQGKQITLALSSGARLPAQLDGEPYTLLGPCELTVSLKDDALMVER
ncbi:hypothetical protein FOZ62_002062 [Perkinsus olseni]|uniref:Diacylglycerol kinase n=1 Tax=Perkinsus olseni TaxID=32597 RepID=A0A7J6N3Z5_PEROL|nr:hypothetical protein FOZ62_002062 [Perkinsus olseni]